MIMDARERKTTCNEPCLSYVNSSHHVRQSLENIFSSIYCTYYIYIHIYYGMPNLHIQSPDAWPKSSHFSPRVIIKVEGCNEVRLIFEVGIPGSGCHIVCFHSRQWHGFSLSGRGAATIFDVDYIPLHSQGVGCRNEQHVINVRRTCALRLNP